MTFMYNVRVSVWHLTLDVCMCISVCAVSTHLTDFSLTFHCVHVEVSLSEPGEDDCGIVSHSGQHYYIVRPDLKFQLGFTIQDGVVRA